MPEQRRDSRDSDKEKDCCQKQSDNFTIPSKLSCITIWHMSYELSRNLMGEEPTRISASCTLKMSIKDSLGHTSDEASISLKPPDVS